MGGLPDETEVNYVYEYTADFTFEKKHVVQSGHTHLGIQTACFAHDRWWFGCYGDPRVLLVTDAEFRMKGKYELDCAYGVERFGDDQLWVAADRLVPDSGHQAMLQAATPDNKLGYRIESDATKGE